MTEPRIACDLDDVIIDFTAGVFRFAGVGMNQFKDVKKYDYRPVIANFTNDIWEKVKDDLAFWESLPPIETRLPKCIAAFITARHTEASKQAASTWLGMHGLPNLPLHFAKDKLQICREMGYTGLVDDKVSKFQSALCLPHTFLVSRPWNRHVETPHRIYRLEELDWRITDRTVGVPSTPTPTSRCIA